MFNKKNILITGGTGSFGNALTLKLIKLNPNKIIIYSRDELKQSEMQKKFNNNKLRFFIGDVRDKDRLSLAMKEIDYVVHAAALKHVPIAEYNPMEAVKTNIIGAENVIFSSIENNVKKIIALSTDKAVNPINLYGATKLVSDKLFISANNLTGKKNIKFSVVRYGNVFNSRGSVFPIFQNIINNNLDKFTITDKSMTRFNLSLNEGVNFVIDSFRRMWGAEIFIPKIPSFKIIDLARALDSKKKIKYIGIRPGEKLHEVLFGEDESHLVYEFKTYYVLAPSILRKKLTKTYSKNRLDEAGKKLNVRKNYSSSQNNFLSINELKQIIKKEK